MSTIFGSTSATSTPSRRRRAGAVLPAALVRALSFHGRGDHARRRPRRAMPVRASGADLADDPHRRSEAASARGKGLRRRSTSGWGWRGVSSPPAAARPRSTERPLRGQSAHFRPGAICAHGERPGGGSGRSVWAMADGRLDSCGVSPHAVDLDIDPDFPRATTVLRPRHRRRSRSRHRHPGRRALLRAATRRPSDRHRRRRGMKSMMEAGRPVSRSSSGRRSTRSFPASKTRGRRHDAVATARGLTRAFCRGLSARGGFAPARVSRNDGREMNFRREGKPRQYPLRDRADLSRSGERARVVRAG